MRPGNATGPWLQVPAPSVFSEATKSLSIVVPAFNEEARLPATLDETLQCALLRALTQRAVSGVCRTLSWSLQPRLWQALEQQLRWCINATLCAASSCAGMNAGTCQ